MRHCLDKRCPLAVFFVPSPPPTPLHSTPLHSTAPAVPSLRQLFPPEGGEDRPQSFGEVCFRFIRIPRILRQTCHAQLLMTPPLRRRNSSCQTDPSFLVFLVGLMCECPCHFVQERGLRTLRAKECAATLHHVSVRRQLGSSL